MSAYPFESMKDRCCPWADTFNPDLPAVMSAPGEWYDGMTRVELYEMCYGLFSGEGSGPLVDILPTLDDEEALDALNDISVYENLITPGSYAVSTLPGFFTLAYKACNMSSAACAGLFDDTTNTNGVKGYLEEGLWIIGKVTEVTSGSPPTFAATSLDGRISVSARREINIISGDYVCSVQVGSPCFIGRKDGEYVIWVNHWAEMREIPVMTDFEISGTSIKYKIRNIIAISVNEDEPEWTVIDGTECEDD